MKHLTALICALILILSIPVAVHAEEDVYTEGTLYYTVGDQTITIVGCFGKKTEVTVPASIAGYPVNTIASGAFTSNRYIEKLNLPDTVTVIEQNAIPKGVRVIYNANTDHPQETPADIIYREPVPAAEQPKSTQPETTAAPKTNTADTQRPVASSPAGGDHIMEGDVEDDEEETTAAPANAASSFAEGTADGQPAAASSASTATADGQPAAAAQDGSGSGVTVALIAIAAGVIAAAAIAFFIIRKKKKAV